MIKCERCSKEYRTKEEAIKCNCKVYTKEQLQEMYTKLGVEDMMRKLKISRPTLLKLLDRAGIERNRQKGNPYNTKKVFIKGVDCE